MSETPLPPASQHDETDHYGHEQPAGRGWLQPALISVVALYVAFSLFLSYRLNDRVALLEARQRAQEEQLAGKISAAESKATQLSATIDRRVGETQKQIANRTAELQRQQRAAESKLTEEQLKQQQALGEVAGRVQGVQTDVGGVKTEVASTKSDLEATKAKLERTIGDLGLQSGLIATTRDQLEQLKHKGDRNYYEFTLHKSKHPTPVSTVSLQLKKACEARPLHVERGGGR